MNHEHHSFTKTKEMDAAKELEGLLEQARTGKMKMGAWDERYDERLSREMTLFREKGYPSTGKRSLPFPAWRCSPGNPRMWGKWHRFKER